MMFAIQSITNSLAEIAAVPKLELFVNGIFLRDNAVIPLDMSRRITIGITNRSMLTAQNVMLDFSCPAEIEPTNLFHDGWQLEQTIYGNKNGMDVPVSYHWSWRADKPVPARRLYYADYLRVSTNIASRECWVFFGVYAERSMFRDYTATLLFQQ